MVECKHAIHFFAEKENTFKAVVQQFAKIEEVVKILKIPYIFTKSIQKADYTLSDVYGSCITLREKLKMFASKRNRLTNLADCLLQEFENKRFRMLRSPIMYATVFLDRRYANDLNIRELELAKVTLCNVWERIQQQHNDQNIEAITEEDDGDSSFDLDQYMLTKSSNIPEPVVENLAARVSNLITTPNYNMLKSDFLLALDKFENTFPVISSKIEILDFIEKNKSQFPEICIVANILFGIPPSQSSVERTFSHYAFVFNSLRNSLKPSLLEKILLIRLNKSLVKQIFQEELNTI